MLLNLTVLPGDGIGPEVTEQAVLVLQAVADGFGHTLETQRKLIGGAALSQAKDPLPADTVQACLASSAVLLGAVGNPAFDQNPGTSAAGGGIAAHTARVGSLREPASGSIFSSARGLLPAASGDRARD